MCVLFICMPSVPAIRASHLTHSYVVSLHTHSCAVTPDTVTSDLLRWCEFQPTRAEWSSVSCLISPSLAHSLTHSLTHPIMRIRDGSWIPDVRGGGQRSNSSPIVPSGYQIVFLLEMSIPNTCAHLWYTVCCFFSPKYTLLRHFPSIHQTCCVFTCFTFSHTLYTHTHNHTPYISGHQSFLAKDHNLCRGDRQDLPIEALREKDCPDSRLYLQLNFYLA